MSKKKIMILGASILQLPAILKAKEMGLEVIVVDYDRNAIGFKYSDISLDISTQDIEKIVNAAKSLKIDGITTIATDLPMISIAQVAFELGLPGISRSTAIKTTNKKSMIESFKNCNVASPWYFTINRKDSIGQLIDNTKYPCILKPVDNSGSRGVIIVKNREELFSGFDYSVKFSKQGEVIVEEYMKGFEVSVETFTYNGVTHVLAITDKVTSGEPYFVELGHSQQTMLSIETQYEIEVLAKKAIDAVNINFGPAHVEIMVTDSGPRVIELGARMGGDFITSHLVPLSTGIDMVRATISAAIGELPDLDRKFSRGSAIRYIEASNGIISEISGIESALKINGVIEVALNKVKGDESKIVMSSNDRIGYVITQGKNPEEAISICEDALSKIKINVSLNKGW